MRFGPLALLAFLTLLPGCGGDSPAGPSDARGRVELRPGQSIALSAGLVVTFDAVISDSRCPMDAMCVNAGEAVVRFTATLPSGSKVVRELRAGGPRTDATIVGDVRVELVALLPYPRAGRAISTSSYTATIAFAPA